MIVHLLESTLLLAMAILIAHIPRLAARTRFVIIFAALLKFAIPSALVPHLLALCGIDLAGMTKGTIFINALGPLTAAGLPVNTRPIWPAMSIAFWLLITTALLARALVRGRAGLRLVRSGTVEADPRQQAALARARTRAGVIREVRLICSSIATPVTIGILRQVILIPVSTQLADPELETILAHECAHIARYDNLLGVIETLFGCALWFHPLVWVARRLLDAAREEACDAVVVASGDSNTYIAALGKVCGAAITPRTAGISCIVSNTIRERMETIMRFGTRRLLPHRTVTATVIALLASATIGSGIAHALPADEDAGSSNYTVSVTATRESSPDVYSFNVSIHDRKSGEIVASARVRSKPEMWATATNSSDHETVIRMIGHSDGAAEVEVTVDHGSPIITKLTTQRNEARKSAHDDAISLDLKDADIRDVLRTFSQLTKIEIIVDDEINGHVSVSMHEIAWPKALEIILRQNNLRQERIANTIHVHRM